MPHPGWYLWMKENKMTAMIGIFFGGNLINGQLLATGAFEIYVDDVLIFSKLQSGKLPTKPEIFSAIQDALEN